MPLESGTCSREAEGLCPLCPILCPTSIPDHLRALATRQLLNGCAIVSCRNSSQFTIIVTQRTGHMGDTFGPNGFSSGSSTRVSKSKSYGQNNNPSHYSCCSAHPHIE